jgi:hypothetical protein
MKNKHPAAPNGPVLFRASIGSLEGSVIQRSLVLIRACVGRRQEIPSVHAFSLPLTSLQLEPFPCLHASSGCAEEDLFVPVR